MMPWFFVTDGPTRSGVSSRTEFGAEIRGQTLLRQFDAIAFDARED